MRLSWAGSINARDFFSFVLWSIALEVAVCAAAFELALHGIVGISTAIDIPYWTAIVIGFGIAALAVARSYVRRRQGR